MLFRSSPAQSLVTEPSTCGPNKEPVLGIATSRSSGCRSPWRFGEITPPGGHMAHHCGAPLWLLDLKRYSMVSCIVHRIVHVRCLHSKISIAHVRYIVFLDCRDGKSTHILHSSRIEVQVLMFKRTLVKVEVLSTPFHSGKVKKYLL